jgi:tripartite ATP-independent transporter DctM subunit
MLILALLLALVVMICLNVPIAVALAVAGVLGLIVSEGTGSLVTIALDMYNGATNFSLIAIPMFVLAGAIMNAGGITDRLINFVSALIGFVRGGLAMINIGVSLFFAEISGSAVADVAALGSVLIPSMKEKGYPAPFAAAVTSSSASLAIIIPPSIAMILYAVLAETSVVQLFVAGIVPGVLGGLLMMGLCHWFARKYNYPVEEVFHWRRLLTTFREAFWALLLPVIVLGGIFGGVVTATEAAGLAVFGALVIGTLIYRELNLRRLYVAVLEGGVQTAVVMLLVGCSAVLGQYLTEQQTAQHLAEAIIGYTQNKYLVLLLLNALFLALGTILHGAAAIILVVPIVMPLVNLVGIDPVHFGIVVTLNLSIGQQTPPVASVLVTACSIARTDIWEVTRVNLPFIGILFFVLMLATYVPFVPMALVELFYR